MARSKHGTVEIAYLDESVGDNRLRARLCLHEQVNRILDG
jgi:hypothetical protein